MQDASRRCIAEHERVKGVGMRHGTSSYSTRAVQGVAEYLYAESLGFGIGNHHTGMDRRESKTGDEELARQYHEICMVIHSLSILCSIEYASTPEHCMPAPTGARNQKTRVPDHVAKPIPVAIFFTSAFLRYHSRARLRVILAKT